MRQINRAARRKALRSDCPNKHSAIVMRGKHIVAIGYNRKSYGCRHGIRSFHAEHDALMKVHPEIDLKDCVMYVSRFNRHGVPRLSKPCTACEKRIKAVGIKTVFYTVSTESEQDLKWKEVRY